MTCFVYIHLMNASVSIIFNSICIIICLYNVTVVRWLWCMLIILSH